MINKLISVLQNRKYFSLKSQGTSMLPMLRPHDLVYYRKITFEKCRVNDLVMVRKGKITFTHRVIYKFPPDAYFVTKGDNNLTSDGKIYPRQIIGKVLQIKRNGALINPENLYLIQSSLYFTEIVKIKKALEKGEIDFVFLKGLPIHLHFEGFHPRRIYADCDVLVTKNKLDKVISVLNKFGYKMISSSLSKLHDIFREKITEIQFYKTINNFPVIFDVHLEIDWMSPQLGKLEAFYPQDLIDNFTNECFESKTSVTVNNEKFLILNSKFLILYLALHFFHHNFRGAYRLEFLDKVIKRFTKGSDLQLFQGLTPTIINYQLQNFVYPVFLFLKKYYKTPIPQEFLSKIQPSHFPLQYLTSILQHPTSIFDDESRTTAGITRFKNLFFLSPNPWWRKMMIIFNPAVIYSVLWVLDKRLSNLMPK